MFQNIFLKNLLGWLVGPPKNWGFQKQRSVGLFEKKKTMNKIGSVSWSRKKYCKILISFACYWYGSDGMMVVVWWSHDNGGDMTVVVAWW